MVLVETDVSWVRSITGRACAVDGQRGNNAGHGQLQPAGYRPRETREKEGHTAETGEDETQKRLVRDDTQETENSTEMTHRRNGDTQKRQGEDDTHN